MVFLKDVAMEYCGTMITSHIFAYLCAFFINNVKFCFAAIMKEHPVYDFKKQEQFDLFRISTKTVFGSILSSEEYYYKTHLKLL